MTHIENINGSEIKVIGSVGLCGGNEIFEVRTFIDGDMVYYEEAADRNEMERWVALEVRQCQRELT